METKELIIDIFKENSNDIDNFNSALFEENYNEVAEIILKLVSDDNNQRKQLIIFAKWWMSQSYIACIIEKEVDRYLTEKCLKLC